MKGKLPDHVMFLSDDEPDPWEEPDESGEPAHSRLHILVGGNYDYYLSISNSERVPMGPSVRARTSGATDSLFTMLVACMYKLGSGDRDGAAECARAFARLCDMERQEP